MNNNILMIAAAGSGKTTYLVNRACELTHESILITTYTEMNEAGIRERIIAKMGYMPSNVTVQTWFSFLLHHGVRPYQSVLNDSIHNAEIGFYLSEDKSGKKYDSSGKPLVNRDGKPIYWGEGNNLKRHYFTKSLCIYSDKISKFIFKSNKQSKNLIVERIERIFDNIFIDEIQDLAGYDLELVKLFFKSQSAVLLVGDPRQVTYLTHHATKFGKYANGGIKAFVENELGKRIECIVDDTTLNVSHRNNQQICNYSAKLYPELTIPAACTCQQCRSVTTDHEGVYLVRPGSVDDYLTLYEPMQLRWSASSKCSPHFQSVNFGQSKGLSFDRVLIYPTQKMRNWIKDNKSELKNEVRAKLYVAITRARFSVGIVMDYDDGIIEGVKKYEKAITRPSLFDLSCI